MQYEGDTDALLSEGHTMAHIHYSNCFMHKLNSCPWQPENHTIRKYASLQCFLKISKRLDV